MTISHRVWNSLCFIAALCIACAATAAKAELTVQGYTPATAGMYDRFLNDPSFIGASYNWSGIGRGINTVSNADVGSWGTMISPSYFISANHFSPSAVGANALRFYYSNSVAGGFEDHTFTAVGPIAGSDLWLGKLNTPVSNNVAKYPIFSPANNASYGGLPIFVVGLSSAFPGNDTSFRLGTNNIDTHNALNNGAPVIQVDAAGTVGYTYTFNYAAGAGAGEAFLQAGDSGAPNLYTVNGNMPAVIGINWFADAGSPPFSGSTAVPKYLTALQAAMTESLTIVQSSPVLGDYSLDGQLTAADVPAMLAALTDLDEYKSLHGITEDYLLQIGDLNADLQITNADIQSLLGLLDQLGLGSGIATVPEPASAALLAFGGLVFALKVKRRNPSPLG